MKLQHLINNLWQSIFLSKKKPFIPRNREDQPWQDSHLKIGKIGRSLSIDE